MQVQKIDMVSHPGRTTKWPGQATLEVAGSVPPNCFIIEDFHPQLGSGQEHWQIHLDGFPKSRECHVQIILEFLEFMKVLKPRMTLCDMQFYTLTIRIASIM